MRETNSFYELIHYPVTQELILSLKIAINETKNEIEEKSAFIRTMTEIALSKQTLNYFSDLGNIGFHMNDDNAYWTFDFNRVSGGNMFDFHYYEIQFFKQFREYLDLSTSYAAVKEKCREVKNHLH